MELQDQLWLRFGKQVLFVGTAPVVYDYAYAQNTTGKSITITKQANSTSVNAIVTLRKTGSVTTNKLSVGNVDYSLDALIPDTDQGWGMFGVWQKTVSCSIGDTITLSFAYSGASVSSCNPAGGICGVLVCQ